MYYSEAAKVVRITLNIFHGVILCLAWPLAVGESTLHLSLQLLYPIIYAILCLAFVLAIGESPLQDGKMARWQDGKMAGRPGGKVARWQGGKVARWQGGKMATWHDGKVAI